jgi:hypothetical protein
MRVNRRVSVSVLALEFDRDDPQCRPELVSVFAVASAGDDLLGLAA